MSNYDRPLKKLLLDCQREVAEQQELTELAEVSLVNLAQLLVLYLDERSKEVDHPSRYLRGLLTLYGATGARDQFRDALRKCLDEAQNKGPEIYAIANQVCYALGSGKLATEDDYRFFESLYTQLYGADYFREIVDRLADSKVCFHVSDAKVS